MQGNSVAIVTNPRDRDSFSVEQGLLRLGASPKLIHLGDFPELLPCSVSLGPDSATEVCVSGLDAAPSTVWWRRPEPQFGTEACEEDKEFTESQCVQFLNSLWDSLPEAFWINPFRARRLAENKVSQLQSASDAGFRIPKTLLSCDPAAVREFGATLEGCLLYKPFSSHNNYWIENEEYRIAYSSRLDLGKVPDESIRLAPGIFQEFVPKVSDVRLVMIGHEAFAAEIYSQEVPVSEVDWRRGQEQLRLETMLVPDSLRVRCVSVLQSLGLVTGSFDFARTQDGDLVFLEINEAGQFLWLEEKTGLPLLSAFCQFMLARRPDFRWSGNTEGILLDSVSSDAEQSRAEAQKRHRCPY